MMMNFSIMNEIRLQFKKYSMYNDSIKHNFFVTYGSLHLYS